MLQQIMRILVIHLDEICNAARATLHFSKIAYESRSRLGTSSRKFFN